MASQRWRFHILSRAGLESSHRGRIDDDMESRGGSYVTSLHTYRKTRRAGKSDRYFDFQQLQICVHGKDYLVEPYIVCYGFVEMLRDRLTIKLLSHPHVFAQSASDLVFLEISP